MSQTLSFADALRSAVDALSDPSVLVLGETAGLSGAPGAETLNVPIADRAAAGLAYGLALGGRKVVLELADTGRLPAIVEVLAEAGAAAVGGEFAPTLLLRVPYGDEAPGVDVAVGRWLGDLPGVRVVCPSSPDLAAGLARTALQTPGVTVLLEPRALMSDRGPVSGAAAPFAARVVREGQHVTLAAWGPSLAAASAAAEALAAEGVEACVIDLVCLAPLDGATLGARVRATGRLVVVHPDDPGLARRIRESALEEGFLYLEAPLAEVAATREQVLAAARGAVSY